MQNYLLTTVVLERNICHCNRHVLTWMVALGLENAYNHHILAKILYYTKRVERTNMVMVINHGVFVVDL